MQGKFEGYIELLEIFSSSNYSTNHTTKCQRQRLRTRSDLTGWRDCTFKLKTTWSDRLAQTLNQHPKFISFV
jgi:hypothetical protein